MLQQQQTSYKQRLKNAINEIITGLATHPVQDMLEYRDRLGKLKGLEEALEIFDTYLKEGDTF